MSQASQTQMQKFVDIVDEFFAKYDKLISPATRNDVYATGDARLIADYESTVTKGRLLKNSIQSTVGAWNAAKAGWSSVTDTTSMYIGDAIDAIKNLFGAGPQLNGLGAIQIPAAAFVVGAIGASAALILSIDRIFIGIEASRIQRDSPGISRENAYSMAKGNVGLDVFGDVNRLAMIAALGFVAYLVYGKK